jgi:hypothetical protein
MQLPIQMQHLSEPKARSRVGGLVLGKPQLTSTTQNLMTQYTWDVGS